MASLVVIDYGSQYTRLIARRLRELQVFSVIETPTVTPERLRRLDARGVVLSGGPLSVYAERAPQLPPGLLDTDLPILAICYGMHLLARALGGEVAPSPVREFGKAPLTEYSGALFAGVEGDFIAWMSHGDVVDRLPAGFVATARTADTRVAAMEDAESRRFGLQFHPEVRHTPKGVALLDRFVELTGVPRDWTATHIVDAAVAEIRARVGNERVLLGISGGVDSTTLGSLLHRALGDRLVPVFVDTGLLRLGEGDEVERALRGLGLSLVRVDARERFLARLAGLVEPEAKRKAIGHTFIDVFAAEARRASERGGPIRYLAQGTLYPDVIESAGAHGAAMIKSHHNVGGLPPDLEFELLEPFRTLFKDEVREVAEALGIPPQLRDRHPFPGPGLAIRVLGEVTTERLEVLRRVDDIFVSALREFGLYQDMWQALAVLTPVRSVGVMGDDRTYAHMVALRAVTSVDGMTADWARLPDEFLATVSNRIVNTVPEVNRVVYDITSKPPGTIEWE